MLITGKCRWRVYGCSLHYFYKSCLKFFKLKAEETINGNATEYTFQVINDTI